MEDRLKLTEMDLPQTFTVKLIGRKPARGLWGIKNTRVPVDEMIADAKTQNLSLPVVNLTVTKEGIIISHFPNKPIPPKRILDYNSNELPDEPKRQIFGLKKIQNLIARKPEHFIARKHENLNVLETDFALLGRLKSEMKLKHDCSFFGIDSISYGVQDMVFTRVFSIIVISDHGDRSRFHCYAFICEDKLVARSLTYSLAAAFQVYSRSLKLSKKKPMVTPVKSSKPKILAVDLRSPEERAQYGKPLDSEA